MTRKSLWLVVVIVAALAVAMFGCNILKKEKPAEKPISVETPPTTTVTPPPETPTEMPTPSGPQYKAGKLDTLKMLDNTLGATSATLGWDNIYCSVCLDKDLELFTALTEHYPAGTADRTFIDQSITDLTNIKNFVSDKMSRAEGIDPNGADAIAKKKQINAIRARVQAMIGGPAPTKKPLSEWEGDLYKEKWKERGDMIKKKWAERDKK